MSTFHELEMRTMDTLERLIAIEEIRSLQARYVRLADAKDWPGLGALFLPDGTFTHHDVAGTALQTMVGATDIVDQIGKSVGGGSVLHHLFSYEIELSAPDRAHGIWAMEDWIDWTADRAAGGEFVTMHGAGHYHVDYVKRGQSWFIAALNLHRVKLDFT
jgi:hypothetical protein